MGRALHSRRIIVSRPLFGHYPGFSEDPMGGFQNLLLDLNQHGNVFLAGSDAEFVSCVKRAGLLARNAPRLP